ncbi:DUF6850 family outer membrane beta-barrel protein [Mangrovibacterium sp.]|uniref:DUF6850 family outer membrane beta-barrel protein n=1 Tax=Mangrovibacterium sp. TaxID=1961364 RepID=UPI003568F4B1
MKKITIILVFTLSALINANARQEADRNNVLLENDTKRSDILDTRLSAYTAMPTNLWQWHYGNISSITFNQFYQSGEFKTVDDFSEKYGLAFESEAIQTIAEKGWVFHGKFAFKSSVNKSADFNMFYAKSAVGSPFRVVTQRTGDFRVKHYGLVGGLSKYLNDKFSVGAQIDYKGDLYFRTLDTRNEQYNLTIETTGSVSYNPTTHRSLSLGLAYYYHKTTNEYTNNFKTSGSEYFLYNLNGLGDFSETELDDHVIITDKNPKLLLSYFSGEKNKLNLLVSVYPGIDKWNNKITSLNSIKTKELFKYEYLNNNFEGSYSISKNKYELFNKLTANVITGNGYEYRGTAYQKTYLYEGLTSAYSTDLYRHNKKLFYKNKLGLGFESIRKKDMTYAQEMKYTNLTASVKTGYFIPVNSRNKLAIDAGVNYKLNLDYLHQVSAAASKPYTTNIAYNEMAFNTADFIQVDGEAKWHGYIGKLKAEYKIRYSYTKPLDIKVVNSYSLLNTNTMKNSLSASLNIYF